MLLLGVVGYLLTGCSAASLVDALTPNEGYHVERDIAYGPNARQRLDLYVPAQTELGTPVILFFYGGRWVSGSKDLYAFAGQALASRGFITAIADYRLYPQVRWTGFLADGAAATAMIWQRLSGSDDTSRPLILAGHSAGAYIAAMLALDQGWLNAVGLEPCRVTAAIGLAGPYDFLPLESATLREIFGPGAAAPATQPRTHVDRNDPPMLLVSGAEDDTVEPSNTWRLAAPLREVGVGVEVRLYPDLGHIGLVAALAAPLRFLAPVLDDIEAFVDGVASVPRNGCAPEAHQLPITSP